MAKILIAVPFMLAGVAALAQQQRPPGEVPTEVPAPPITPDPQPPREPGQPIEAPPIAPPPPGESPPMADTPASLRPGQGQAVPDNPSSPPVATSPMPASSSPRPVPMAGGERTVTNVNNSLPPAPAAQQTYPPCSATVRDQCQQREGRQPRRRAPR